MLFNFGTVFGSGVDGLRFNGLIALQLGQVIELAETYLALNFSIECFGIAWEYSHFLQVNFIE